MEIVEKQRLYTFKNDYPQIKFKQLFVNDLGEPIAVTAMGVKMKLFAIYGNITPTIFKKIKEDITCLNFLLNYYEVNYIDFKTVNYFIISCLEYTVYSSPKGFDSKYKYDADAIHDMLEGERQTDHKKLLYLDRLFRKLKSFKNKKNECDAIYYKDYLSITQKDYIIHLEKIVFNNLTVGVVITCKNTRMYLLPYESSKGNIGFKKYFNFDGAVKKIKRNYLTYSLLLNFGRKMRAKDIYSNQSIKRIIKNI